MGDALAGYEGVGLQRVAKVARKQVVTRSSHRYECDDMSMN